MTAPSETPTTGERVTRAVLVACGVVPVLFLAAGGWFLVGLEAQSTCTPDGNDASCPRAALLPWVQVAAQVAVLVTGLAVLPALLRRSRSAGGRVAATVAVGTTMPVVAVLVLLLLLRAASW